MKTMGHKIQTRIISALLVFVMVFASIVSAGIVLDVDFGKMFSALGFGSGDSGTNLDAQINTENLPSNHFITPEGNYGYEIVPTVGLTVDGVREEAYTKAGVSIPANYIMPNSASTFDVYFAADGKNIYVLYEFSKAEPIYFDSAYTGGFHHFDLAEFHMDLNAKLTSGDIFQINGGIEGDETSATKPNIVNNSLGVTDYTVKHTGKGGYGYNIEFAIPLSRVTGSYNGNKAVTFTALSTISTSYDSTTKAAPKRYYTFAKNAWSDANLTSGDADTPKLYPSTLVIKSNEFTTGAGNIGHTIEKTTGLALDGVRDEAYDLAGVTLPSKYDIANGTFDFSFAADSENVYFLYEITKTCNNTLYYDENHYEIKADGTRGTNWFYRFDGVDFILRANGGENIGGTEFHIMAINEGYGKDPTTGAAGTAISYDNALGSVSNFYVKHIEKNDDYIKYNVEFTVPISNIGLDREGNHVLTYMAMADMTTRYNSAAPHASGSSAASYPIVDNALHTNGNGPKTRRNMIVIKNDAATGNADEVERFTTANRNYGYIIDQSATNLSVDGEKDAAYTKTGFTLPGVYRLPVSGSKFDVSFAADSTHLYVLYEFDKAEAIAYYGDSYLYRLDNADFTYNLNGSETSGANAFHIWGVTEGGVGVAKNDIIAGDCVDNYYVKHTEGYNYNVEFSIPLNKITGVVNGHKAMTFTAIGTLGDTNSGKGGTYGIAYCAVGWEDKAKPSMVVIRSPKEDDAPDAEVDYLTPYGGYGYLLQESDSWLTTDGYKDEAYKAGLKFSNKYNRLNVAQGYTTTTPDPDNTYTLYMAADTERVHFLYEFADENIVIDGSEPYYNDGVQFTFNKDGLADGTISSGNSVYYTTGPRTGSMNFNGVRAPYILVKTEKGYNVEFSISRDEIANGDTFSFLGRSTLADSADKRTYGFTENALKGADDKAISKYCNQVHIVSKGYDDSQYDEVVLDAGTDGTSGRWKYYIEQTDKAFVNDGVMDEAYNDGLKFDQMYNRVQNGLADASVLENNKFTVYVAANETDLSFFYEVIDDEIVTTAPSSSTHWNDSLHFRMAKDGDKNGTPFNQVIQAGTEVKAQTFTANGQTFTYSVVHTDKGYNVEITTPRSALENQSTFSYIGIISIAWTLAGGDVKNTYGFTANAGGDAQDASLQNYANFFEIVDEIPALDVKATEIYTDIEEPTAGSISATNPANVPDSKTTYDSYNAYKSDIVLDGYRDDSYANAAHFYADLCDNPGRNGKTTFDAYVAYGSDGYIYFYVDINDDFVKFPVDLYNKTYYHTDYFQIYLQYGENPATQGIYGISAPEAGVANRSKNKSPIAVSKRLTANGWAFEAVIKYNNNALLTGNGTESVAVKFFYNDLWEFNGLAGNNVAGGYRKNTVTHSDFKYLDKYDTPETPGTLSEDWAAVNRVNFVASGAPVNNTYIFNNIATSDSVVIVYPKEASQGLLDLIRYPKDIPVREPDDKYTGADGNQYKYTDGISKEYYDSLYPLSEKILSNVAVLEEGNANIANYTYKILVGHVNSYLETEAMINSIGYDKYGVGVFGNTVSIIGPTEQMLKKAIGVFEDEIEGTLDPKTLYYGGASAVAGGDLTYLDDVRIVTDNGYGSYQIVKNNVEYADFIKYGNALLANGYKLHSYNGMGGNYSSMTFYNATDIVTVGYGLHYSMHLYYNYSGSNFYNSNDANLDNTENSLRISVTSRAIADLPANAPVEYEKVADTVYSHATQDWDLLEIVRLENGEFIIFDAAHTVDAPAIIQELYALSNGEKPVVAGWFLTHFHQDHIGGLVEIGTKYADKVTVKNVIAHLGSEQIVNTCFNYRGNSPSTSDCDNLKAFLPAIENLGAKLNVTATGQVYTFANASVEVLYTFADSMPFNISCDNTNRTDSIYALTLKAGNVNQKFIITGDATTEEFNLATKRYGSYLKADFAQLAHHGRGEANDRCTTFYQTIDPSFLIVPRAYVADKGYGASDIAAMDYVRAKYENTVNEEEYIIAARRYVTNAEIKSVKDKFGSELISGEAQNVYAPQIRRIAIPYTVGKTFEFPGVGEIFTAEFNNTATGNAGDDDGLVANTDDRITQPTGTNENGSYVYVANTVYTDITTDGAKDAAYSYGIHLKDNKNDDAANDGEASFDVYLVAGQDGKLHVFYEVVDNYYFVTTDANSSVNHRLDGIDFYFGFGKDGVTDGDFRIKAVDGANTLAAQDEYRLEANRDKIFADRDDKNEFAVTVTNYDNPEAAPVIGEKVKYTVEFTIDNDGVAFENGDTFTFGAYLNSVVAWDSVDVHDNYNLMTDTALTSSSGNYYAPGNMNGKNNVLVFSTAPATEQAQRPASGSDNDIECAPATGVTFDKQLIGTLDKNASFDLATNVATDDRIYGTVPTATAKPVYGIKTAYADITTDGEMETIYKYGYKVSSKYASTTDPGTHGFDAYLVYAEDGKLHIFVEVTDSTMTTVDGQKIGYGYEKDNEANNWRADSVHFYYNFTNDGTASKNVWIGAVEGDQSKLTEKGTLPSEYFVKMTDKGYNVEFIIDRNGGDFNVGDYFEFGLYLNCASSEVSADYGNDTNKYSMTHGSFYNDTYAKKYVDPHEFAYDGFKIVSTESVTAGYNTDHADENGDNVCDSCGETLVMLGDADGDGFITTGDALSIYLYILDPVANGNGFIFDAADNDGDGYITTTDALSIYLYILDPIANPFEKN